MIYQCQPATGTSPGLRVLHQATPPALVVYDAHTDEPTLVTPMPAEHVGTSEASLLTEGIIFALFPDRQWSIGTPVVLDVTAGIGQRGADQSWGDVVIKGQSMRWTAAYVHRPECRTWQYDIVGWPAETHRLDVVAFGRIIDVIHGLHLSDRAEVTVQISNVFDNPLPFSEPQVWEVAGGSLWRKFRRRLGAC